MKIFTFSRRFLCALFAVLFGFAVFNAGAQTAVVNPSAIVRPMANINVALSQTGGANNGYSWSVYSKPAGAPANGDVSITGLNATTGAATAVFTTTSVEGVYTFQLAQGAVTSDIDVTIVPAANSPLGCSGKFLISYGTASSATSTTNVAQLLFSASGLINPIAYTTSPTAIGFNGIGINPIDGYMYGLRYPANSSSKVTLVKVGVAGTNITDLGTVVNTNLPNNVIVYAGDFDATGTFYFIDADNRFFSMPNAELNTTRTATYIGLLSGTGNNTPPSGSDLIADIAINPINGDMYGVSLSPSFKLYKVNKATGALTAIGGANTYPHPGNAFQAALFFTEDGSLYGYRSDGTFHKFDLTTASTTQVGVGSTYSLADGCSCAFRVGHTLTTGAFCPSAQTPHPDFPVNIVINNSSGAPRAGLTFTLNISDPAKRFRFVEATGSSVPATTATIAQNLFNAGLLPNNNAANITLSTVAPATGTNYNKIVVDNFQVPFGAVNYSTAFRVQFYTLGTPYATVPFQSVISGLPAGLGGTDVSGNGVQPHTPTMINFVNCQGGPLPLKLLSFSGTYKNIVAQLYWETANQVNTDHFDIERSSNGTDFASIGALAAQLATAGTQKYQYNDDLSTATGNVFYYRLRIVDIDGRMTYSNIILIRRETRTINDINIIPNPVISGNTVTARFTAAGNGTVNFRVIDMTGKILLQQQGKAYEGINSTTINNLNRLQSGVYVLEVNDGTSSVTTRFTVLR